MSKSKICKLKILVLVLVLCYSFNSCRIKQSEDFGMIGSLVEINEKVGLLVDSTGSEYPGFVVDYFKLYGLDFGSVGHYFGMFESGGDMLAGHIYKPAKYHSIVVVAHGYFDHCGQMNHLIGHLLDDGFAVGCFDLPGHGLSGGERAAIDDFSQYSEALGDFAEVVAGKLEGKVHFVGHSTGAAAMIDTLLMGGGDNFDKVVLAGPLVHCEGWELSKLSLLDKLRLVKHVPRVFRANSSDEDFINFVKNEDSLHSKELPLKWVCALHRWDEKISGADSCGREVMVVQGTEDKTVDWRYNLKFLKDKFGGVKVNMIDGGRHELFNESIEMREDVFFLVSSYLKD